jgi:hypothetical protein
MRKHQLPTCFAQMPGGNRDISARIRGAPQ